MPCDTLAEFRDLATYRKSFNGDLMMAKSRPQKFYLFENFPFETAKGPLLVLGKIDKGLLDELKKLGKTIKAKGECSFKDNVVALNVTDGKLDESLLKKALALANVKREGTVGDGDSAMPENKGKGEALGLPSEKFTASRGAVQKLLDRKKEVAFVQSNVKRGADAEDKIRAVERYLLDVQDGVEAAEAASKAMGTQWQAERRDPRAKLFQREFEATVKLMTKQAALVKELEKEAAALRKELLPLKLLAKELTASSRVFELKLRAATLKYSVHGDKTRTLHNEKDVRNALDALVAKLAPKPTASKFLTALLEKEAVNRAVGLANQQCKWTEIQTDGRWTPLNAMVFFLGKPVRAEGWSLVDPSDAGESASKQVGEALDEFREGKLNTAQAMTQVNEALDKLAEQAETGAKAPMIRNARVTLVRVGGKWTSPSHYPDRGAAPPGWSIRGKTVRAQADAQPMVAPTCVGA